MYSETQRLRIVLNMAILGMAFYVIAHQDFQVQKVSLFERMVINTFAPVQRSVTSLKEGISYFIDNYFFLVGASKENKKLKKKVHLLETQVFQSKEIKRENNRLKNLLRFGREINHTKVLAQVVGWDASSTFKVLRINKGTDDGIKLQSTAVTSSGLVGYVFRATGNYSDILTIIDQHNRTDAIVARTRSYGIIEGHADSKCIMKYVTRTEPVELGDAVITSGLSNIYPKGLQIGNITKIERESYGITQYIEITPVVDFTKLEEVIVLVSVNDDKKKKELKNLNQMIMKDES